MSATLNMRFDIARLPGRGDVQLHREQQIWPSRVMALVGDSKASPESAAQLLTMELLAQGFRERDGTRMPAAGFLAGRCMAPSEANEATIIGWLQDAVASFNVAELMSYAPSYVESAMSLGLRGDIDSGHRALTVCLAPGVDNSHDWLAAYYLAQYGDSAGWPAIVNGLKSRDEHNRLFAARHVVGFVPFEGSVVEGFTIDVRETLMNCLDDIAFVAVEIPGLLAEARVRDLHSVLKQVAASALTPEARGAAADVLRLVGQH